MAEAMRPLSPHLQVYRWYWTMGLSIAHRVTGAGLAVGLVLLSWWLLALGGGAGELWRGAGLDRQLVRRAGAVRVHAVLVVPCARTGCGTWSGTWGTGWTRAAAHKSGLVVAGAAVVLTLLTWAAILLAGRGAGA